MDTNNDESSEPDVGEEEFNGTPVFPPGTSNTHRRRLLQAMAGGGTVAVAGCLDLFGDASLAVQTDEAMNVNETGATLNGELTELDGADEATVGFEYGEAGGDLGESVDAGTRSGPDFFEADVSGLEPGTDYEFRAVAEADGTSAEGETLAFTTEADPEEAQFSVALEAPDELGINEEFELVGTVENVGTEAEIQEVTLSFEGETLGEEVGDSVTEELDLDAGESESLSLDVLAGAPGDGYDFEIASDDDSATDSRRVGEPDYTEIDFMTPHWAPKDLAKDLDMQFAYNEEEIWMRFEWDWDVPNGWFHDLFVYDEDEDEWSRYGEPNPGAADPDYGLGDEFDGFTEDRIAVMIDDGSVEGFENFGGWLTIHEGTRTLPGAVAGDEVEDHPHHGDFLGNDDVRKYIPQSRGGDWWENDWDDVKDQSELEAMLEDGEFIDMPMVRCARGLPAGYATVHTILDHRHGALDPEVWGPVEHESTRVRDSRGLDEDGRPQYMFDTDLVENGALELDDIYDGEITTDDVHAAIHRDPDRDEDAWPPDVEDTVEEFDPDVAEFDGAVVPRRHLFPDEVEGPGGLWKVRGGWEDGTWTIEMFKERETEYITEKDIEEGEVYTISPGVHAGGAQRWHWVCYPLKLAIGEDAEVPEEWEGWGDTTGTAVMTANQFDGDEPDWDDVELYTTAMMYPGLTDWTWLTSGEHPRVNEIRNADIQIWEYHDENPQEFAERMISLEERFAPRK